jgi:hypothetical protein
MIETLTVPQERFVLEAFLGSYRQFFREWVGLARNLSSEAGSLAALTTIGGGQRISTSAWLTGTVFWWKSTTDRSARILSL